MYLYNVRRFFKHWIQRRTRGWDDSELWCLETSMAKFMLPRFKRYREVNNGVHSTFFGTDSDYSKKAEKKALKAQTRVFDAIEYYLTVASTGEDGATWNEYTRIENKKFKEGRDAFFEHLDTLWW